MPEQQASPDILRFSKGQLKDLFTEGKARVSLPKRESQEPTGDLVTSEVQAWQSFLGEKIDVPPPPQELLDTQKRAREKGITTLEPHYLPAIGLAETVIPPSRRTKKGGGPFPREPKALPGWSVKPNDWFWEQIKGGSIDKDATELSGQWVLIDNSPKPPYDNGKQNYESDPLRPLMIRMRDEDKIASSPTSASRFSTSWDELHEKVLPELAHDLGVRNEQVRLPKAIEFNVLGNMHHKEWGETNTWEWFEDKFASGSRLIGGSSDDGGLAYVSWNQPGRRSGSIGFRPLIVFSS